MWEIKGRYDTVINLNEELPWLRDEDGMMYVTLLAVSCFFM
jgi:hypothetical protein